MLTLTYFTKNTILLLIIIIGFSFSNLHAQVTPKDSSEEASARSYYLIKKTDGNELFGYVVSDDGREILLITKTIGKIYINKSDIKEITKLTNNEVAIKEGNSDDEYKDARLTGAYTTRYFFTTNALPIKKGEDYAMINLYGPEVHFAITDNFSLGVMSTWIASPIALAAKYSFNSESKTHFSLGSIFGSSGYLFQGQGYGGLHFATITQGSRKANISFSAGYAHIKLPTTNISNNNQLGEKYEIDIGNDDYNARNAIEDKVYWGIAHDDRYFYRNQGIRDALVISVAGIAPVGKKASFIFDSMAFIRSRKKEEVNYKDYNVTVTYDKNTSTKDPYGNNTITPVSTTETFTIGKGALQESGKESAATIILMPAMRFNKSYNKAFQVALAGVINIDYNKNVRTFPVPMVSWLRSF